MKIRNFVQQYRELAGMTQKELAEKIDTGQSYISEIESGQAMPSYLTICKLANALGVEVTKLFPCEVEQ